MLSRLNDLDLRYTSKLHLQSQDGWIKRAAAFVAHSGDSWFNLIAVFILWLFTRNPWHSMAVLMAGTIVILAVMVLIVKFRIGRKRPEGEWGAIYRNTDPHSFPSGHAARTAMLAYLAFAYAPVWLGIVLSFWCVLVCLARVSLRVHYLSDILAGILVGIFAGWVVTLLAPALISLLPWFFTPFF
ncbi:MAG: phosphatase PAP2 family protein [Anaerolineaceae bacterium]